MDRRRLLPLLLTVIAAAPAQTLADTGAATRLQNVGSATIILAVAVGLLLTLLLRPTISTLIRHSVERLGRRRISRLLHQKSTSVLDDFIIPGAYGGLTRIDHALLTGGGIICIQTKHYDGIVFGEPNDPQWTNVRGGRRRKFLNPQIQNEGRANALRKIMPDLPVANLVVFTGNVEFTSVRDRNVIHLSELESFVSKFEFGPSKVSDWDAVWLTLRSAALMDDDSRKDFEAQLSFG